jgi:NAD(P)-dependent dehydrogenase (short-subunit alcohol dehydrogenase family)
MGLVIACWLVGAEADVVILGRDKPRNARAEEECRNFGPGRVASLARNLASEAENAAAMQFSIAFLGRHDCCFAHAGRGGSGRRLVDMSSEGWDVVQELNTRSVAMTYKNASRQMIAQRAGGKLMVISSDQSIMGVNRSADYAALKAACDGPGIDAALGLACHRVAADALPFGYCKRLLQNRSHHCGRPEFRRMVPKPRSTCAVPERSSGWTASGVLRLSLLPTKSPASACPSMAACASAKGLPIQCSWTSRPYLKPIAG